MPDPLPSLEQAIRDNAAGPKRAQGDAGSVEQHSLPDQIEAVKFLASAEAAKKPAKALRLTRLVPPGAEGGLMLGLFKSRSGAPSAPRARSAHKGGLLRRLVVGTALRAGFDSAVTNDANRRHWASADGLSADAAASPEVRRTLRNRARYETANNAYAKGIVLTLANDVVGTGPRLQLLTNDATANRRVEELFEAWAAAIDLPGKLRTMRMARAESGEAFGLLVSSPGIDSPVKLDLRLIEPEQVASPHLPWTRGARAVPSEADGIVLDAYGLPAAYRVLRHHPGEANNWSGPGFGADPAFDTLPASSVLHYFRPDRPGQLRGVPDITPALPLFAQLRRFTLAVLGAAETAADFAGILYTDAPANGEAESVEPMDAIELEARSLLTMPGGWKMAQVQAEQPATTFAEFKREILNEIARCLNMPFNVAACNSSGYNYASGRLDHQTYFKSIRVEQEHLACVVLDRLLNAWLREAVLISDLLPLPVRTLVATGMGLPHQWFWDGNEHVDPAKEATAQATRLASHTTTLAAEYARQGRDWENELRQRAKEVSLMKELGLAPEPAESLAPVGTGKEDDDA